jgi:membrane protease YdiL (CAAX protease family)
MAGQLFGAVVGVCVVFTVFLFTARDPGQFANDQLEGFTKAVDPKSEGQVPIPSEIGESLAWGLLAAPCVSLILIALVLPRRIGPDWKRQLGVHRPHWLHVLLVLMILPGFMLGADAIQSAFLWVIGQKPQEGTAVLTGIFANFPWPLTALAIAVGPAVVEEFWCRGFIGRGLSARFGLPVGVLFTSGMFALMHVDPLQLIVFTLMGAYLHFVYLATRCIWMPILLHALNNGIGILLVLAVPPDKFSHFPPLVVSLLALTLLGVGSLALWKCRAKLNPLPGDDPTWWEDLEWDNRWKPEYPGISAPPPEANLRLGHASANPVVLVLTVLSFGAVAYLCYRFFS